MLELFEGMVIFFYMRELYDIRNLLRGVGGIGVW